MPKKQVGNTFVEKNVQPTFFGKSQKTGEFCKFDNSLMKHNSPQPFYRHPKGTLWIGDSLKWLESIEPESIDLIFADPPYSIKKADWDYFTSNDEYIDWSLKWIELAAKALKGHGSLYICGFSEILAELKGPASKCFYKCKWLVWFYKNKANLGNNWGRSHESILHLRKSKDFTFNVDSVRIPYSQHTLKYPEHPQATSSQYGNGKKKQNNWTPHPEGAKPKDVFEIPVTSNGMKEKTPHPTQKPEELLRKIILASSNEGDLVVDPFSGSGTTLVCAEQLNRKWEGCDINSEYNSWAATRIENIPHRNIRKWMETDRATAKRRESIR
jgi:site-specific DNA-methyltransferase (adenine-specific)